MTNESQPPASDEADTEQMTTPGGHVGALEDLAETVGATTDPEPSDD